MHTVHWSADRGCLTIISRVIFCEHPFEAENFRIIFTEHSFEAENFRIIFTEHTFDEKNICVNFH